MVVPVITGIEIHWLYSLALRRSASQEESSEVQECKQALQWDFLGRQGAERMPFTVLLIPQLGP